MSDIDDDCGPEIEDLYNTETLRIMAHKEALKRPDLDEFTTRVIAMIQLVESQRRSAESLAAVDRSNREHWARDQQRIDAVQHERDSARQQLAAAQAEVERLGRVVAEEQRLGTARMQAQLDISNARDRIARQLAAMTAARDEACEIAAAHAEWNGDHKDLKRIAALRETGKL